MKKRILSLLLCVSMLANSLQLSVVANEKPTVTFGGEETETVEIEETIEEEEESENTSEETVEEPDDSELPEELTEEEAETEESLVTGETEETEETEELTEDTVLENGEAIEPDDAEMTLQGSANNSYAVGSNTIYESESNNTMSTANPVYSDSTISGRVRSSDQYDYFVFKVSKKTKITLAWYESGRANIGLKDSSGEYIYTLPFLEEGQYTLEVSAGTYYIEVLYLNLVATTSWVDYAIYLLVDGGAGNPSGTCGENLTWTLSDGVLTIDGTGKMASYSSASDVPWDYFRNDITKVVFGRGVSSFAGNAFNSCNNIKSYDVDSMNRTFESVNGILFNEDKSILVRYPSGKTATSYTVPSSVTTIWDGAFRSNDYLQNISIPNSVIEIRDSVFGYCYGLTNIEVASSNSVYKSSSGILFSKDMGKLICYPAGKTATSYTIPNSVLEVGDDAFKACGNLQSVTIPGSVINLGEYAFYACFELETIKIPISVESIGYRAFDYCDNLSDVHYGGNNANWKSISIDDGNDNLLAAELHCSNTLTGNCGDNMMWSLTEDGIFTLSGTGEMTLYESADEVPWKEHKDYIEKVVIGAGITSISIYAFVDCDYLQSYEAASSSTKYKSVDGVLFSKDGKTLIRYPQDKAATSYSVPSTVTTILSEAFASAHNLKTITIANSVAEIGQWAFDYCSSLENINVSSSNSYYKSVNGVLFDKDGQVLIRYPQAKTATSYTVPTSVTTIADSSFLFCFNLNDVTIPDGVTNIDQYAFWNCENLKTVTIPASVRSIGYGAFNLCNSLNDVYFGGNRTIWNSIGMGESNNQLLNANIHYTNTLSGTCGSNLKWTLSEDGTFTLSGTGDMTLFGSDEEVPWDAYRDSIKKVVIGSDVTSISANAFSWCYNLQSYEADSSSTKYKTVDGVLYRKDMSELLRYPQGKTATSYTVPSGVTTIWSKAFESCYNLKTITIPYNVTSIEKWAFDYCSGLENINVASSNSNYKSVNGVLFSKDGKTLIRYPEAKTATSYTVPNTVVTIGDSAFLFCDNLQSVTLQDGVTNLEQFAFAGCEDLNTITIPASVESIGRYAFVDCENIQKVYYGSTQSQWKTVSIGEENELLLNANICFVGHEYNSVITAPTCTEQGYTTYTCIKCGNSYVDSYVNAKGHTEVTVAGKAATCTEAGLTDGKKCSACGVVTVKQEVIPAKGHTFKNGSCTICGEKDATVLKGDTNGDNMVNSADVNLLYRAVMGYVTLTDEQMILADVNKDGKVNSADVNLLYRFVMGYVQSLTV